MRLVEEETVGGLILAQDIASGLAGRNGKSRVMGEVIAIGGDEDDGDEYFPVQVGDIVMFGVNSGVKIALDAIGADGSRSRHEVLVFRVNEILTKVVWDERPE